MGRCWGWAGGRTFVSTVVTKRAVVHTAHLSLGVPISDVDGGDMET